MGAELVTPAFGARALALLAALVVGCSGDVTAIDVYLIPDPNITVREHLLQMIDRVELRIDSPDGLYPMDKVGQYGQLRIEDIDADGAAEAIFVANLSSALPIIRMDRGGLVDRALDIQVLGLEPIGERRSAAIATGSVQGVRFEEGVAKPLEIPFNIAPQFRPPRVNQTIPANGATIEPGLSEIFVIFSKKIDAASLSAEGSLSLESITSAKRSPVPIRSLIVQQLAQDFTTVRLEVDALEPKTYGLRVSTGVVDDTPERRPLDQVPGQAGNQPFYGQFVVVNTASSAATVGDDCVPVGAPCPRPTVCDLTLGMCRFRECPTSCPHATVCDETVRVCVDDCRLTGDLGCPEDRPRCGLRGVCKAIDG